MSDHAVDLIAALEIKNAPAFAAASRRARTSEAELKRTVDSLLISVTSPDASHAKLAIDALRFSGLALDGSARQKLVEAVERMYPAEVLERMASDELTRERRAQAKQSVQLELLKSVIMAMLRDGGARQAAFVRLAETTLEGTGLGAEIRAWRIGNT